MGFSVAKSKTRLSRTNSTRTQGSSGRLGRAGVRHRRSWEEFTWHGSSNWGRRRDERGGSVAGACRKGAQQNGRRHPWLSTGQGAGERRMTASPVQAGMPTVSYVMTATGGSGGACCVRDHTAPPAKPLVQLKRSWGHGHSDSRRLHHIQILATDPYLTSSTATQPVSHSWLMRTGL